MKIQAYKLINVQTRNSSTRESGQAVIVLVMIVSIIAIIFTHVAFMNTSALVRATDVVRGDILRIKTEGYLENGAIRYIRNPEYAGESLNEGAISCTITVSDLGGGVTDIESSCTEGGRNKAMGVTITFNSGIFEFSKAAER